MAGLAGLAGLGGLLSWLGCLAELGWLACWAGLAGLGLPSSSKVLPHMIGSESLIFVNILFKKRDEFDSHNFMILWAELAELILHFFFFFFLFFCCSPHFPAPAPSLISRA